MVMRKVHTHKYVLFLNWCVSIDLGMIFDWFCDFSKELHVNVFAYDYEGYGKSSGVPSEAACYEDIEYYYVCYKSLFLLF